MARTLAAPVRSKANVVPPEYHADFLKRIVAREQGREETGAAVSPGARRSPEAASGSPIHQAEVCGRDQDQHQRHIWEMEAVRRTIPLLPQALH